MAHLAGDVEHILISQTRQNIADSPQGQRFIVIGHSMGAKIAYVLAGRSQIPIDALVLVSPAPPTPFILPSDMREQQMHAYDDSQNAEFVIRHVLSALPLGDETVAELVDGMVSGSVDARAAWPAYGMGEDVSTLLAMFAGPVLIVAASHDRVEPVERVESETFGFLKCQRGGEEGLRMIVVECGHLVPLEQPMILAREIEKFIADNEKVHVNN
jgi:3-oxoadipate enol-lactonase